MVRLGTSSYSIKSCIIGPTSHKELVEHNRANSSSNNKKKNKIAPKIEFLDEKSILGASIVAMVRVLKDGVAAVG